MNTNVCYNSLFLEYNRRSRHFVKAGVDVKNPVLCIKYMLLHQMITNTDVKITFSISLISKLTLIMATYQGTLVSHNIQT